MVQPKPFSARALNKNSINCSGSEWLVELVYSVNTTKKIVRASEFTYKWMKVILSLIINISPETENIYMPPKSTSKLYLFSLEFIINLLVLFFAISVLLVFFWSRTSQILHSSPQDVGLFPLYFFWWGVVVVGFGGFLTCTFADVCPVFLAGNSNG